MRGDLLAKGKEILERLKSEKAAVVVHRHADPDAVASAAFFWRAGAVPYAPGGLSSLGRRVAESVGMEFREGPIEEEWMIIVDTASSSQLPGVDLTKEYCRVDHHAQGDLKPCLVDPEASSTSEIVSLLARELGVELDERMARALMLGIYVDSKGFKLSRPQTFSAMEYLSEFAKLSDALKMLPSEKEEDLGTRIAKLKACERLTYRKVKDYIIAVTRVGANEGAVLRTLIQCIGADAAFVVREGKEELRVYARASPRLTKLGINLAEFLSALAEEFGGRGGGHPGAAGAVLPTSVSYETLVNKIFGRLSRRIAEALR